MKPILFQLGSAPTLILHKEQYQKQVEDAITDAADRDKPQRLFGLHFPRLMSRLLKSSSRAARDGKDPGELTIQPAYKDAIQLIQVRQAFMHVLAVPSLTLQIDKICASCRL